MGTKEIILMGGKTTKRKGAIDMGVIRVVGNITASMSKWGSVVDGRCVFGARRYMYVYGYVRTRVCACVYIYTCMYTWVRICTYACYERVRAVSEREIEKMGGGLRYKVCERDRE